VYKELYRKKRMKSYLIIFWFGLCSAVLQTCPSQWSVEKKYKDLVFLADVVSWNSGYEQVRSNYRCVYEKEGLYDTRMRIYMNTENETIITFRPTQSTTDGGQIHVDRHLSNCTFLNDHCKGRVHDRFQSAFNSLIDAAPFSSLLQSSHFIVGHSLGGSFSLFMALYSYHVLQKIPKIVLGLAGPFIGDDQFAQLYEPLYQNTEWYQVESVNKWNPSEFDGTVQEYNVDHAPYINIYEKAICTVTVPKLPDSYGMHDLRNYALFFTG